MTDRIEEEDVVVMTGNSSHTIGVHVGSFGRVIETRRHHEDRFLRVIFEELDDQPPTRRELGIWVEAGDVELALDPLYILSEEYFW